MSELWDAAKKAAGAAAHVAETIAEKTKDASVAAGEKAAAVGGEVAGATADAAVAVGHKTADAAEAAVDVVKKD